jgi:superfamily II DNA or RNA helicase
MSQVHSCPLRFEPAAARWPERDYQRSVRDALRSRVMAAAFGELLGVVVATGGGKTRIANDLIALDLLPRGDRILWVAKDWMLVRQAAEDLVRRHDCLEVLGRHGGTHKFPELRPQGASTRVTYTTLQSAQSLRRRGESVLGYDIVIVDESHWGEGGRLQSNVLNLLAAQAVVIGLTATPRTNTRFLPVHEPITFRHLVEEGYLARPILESPCQTNARWTARLDPHTSDIARPASRQLARDEDRNALIVSTFMAGRDLYEKTLMFAIDIPHALRLVELLRLNGVLADYIHWKMKACDRDQVLENFRTGSGARHSRTEVLVNVETMTHGVDIPDVRTVFLARPTASAILYQQMIGRGARRIQGVKDAFRVVEFADESPRGESCRVTAEALFADVHDGGEHRSRTRSVALEVPTRHEFAPSPMVRYPGSAPYGDMAGFELQPRQTFGIEFEFDRLVAPTSTSSRALTADMGTLLASLRDVLGRELVASRPGGPGSSDGGDRVWRVKPDGSCALEVTTRVCVGEAGYEEVHRVCAAMQSVTESLGLGIKRSTGTHIHLGWRPTPAELARLVRLSAFFEPALRSVVAPSRTDNQYCSSIGSNLMPSTSLLTLADWKRYVTSRGRYMALNLCNLFNGKGTVEVRLHSGTQEARKILAWVSLWMRVLEAVQRGVDAPEEQFITENGPFVPGPRGDILQLLRHVGAGRPMVDYFRARRDYLLDNSWVTHWTYGALAEQMSEQWRASDRPYRQVENR